MSSLCQVGLRATTQYRPTKETRKYDTDNNKNRHIHKNQHASNTKLTKKTGSLLNASPLLLMVSACSPHIKSHWGNDPLPTFATTSHLDSKVLRKSAHPPLIRQSSKVAENCRPLYIYIYTWICIYIYIYYDICIYICILM